jgi:hypothetical protein
MNDHWNVLYQVSVFYADWKSKMATTTGHRLTLDPMGKMLQNASSLKPLGQLKPNCPGMIIGRSSTKFLFFMPIGNPRWPLPQDIQLTLVVSNSVDSNFQLIQIFIEVPNFVVYKYI